MSSAVITEKRDIKANAIGMATKWLKRNFQNFTLPLVVRRIMTSGQYIMKTTVSAKKSKDVYLKVVDGEVKQTSVKEWDLNDPDNDSEVSESLTFKQFLEQEKPRKPAYDPKLDDLENKHYDLKREKDLKRRSKNSNGKAFLKPQAE